MMRVWVFQDTRQKKKLGAKCPWSVGWYDPEGRKRSKRIGSRSMATKHARKIEGQLAAGTYESTTRKDWADFRAEWEAKIGSGLAPETRRVYLDALRHFERIVRPSKLASITTATVDGFVAQRRTERGVRKGDTVSPATVNKELRHIRAVLRIAADWGYLSKAPKVRMVKEAKKLPRYVTAEHFAQIYDACDVAQKPCDLPYSAADWWRGLLTYCYMTGWRVSETLAVCRDDVDLENATVITWADDNKGRRDESVPLHPVVVEHLRRIVSFDSLLFPWTHHERTLWSELLRIQQSAGIHLTCRKKHKHTPSCHVYGFHDLRRAFATENAGEMSADALQALMRHKSYATTQLYINMSRQLNRAVDGLHVPEVLRRHKA